jgi:hypothetical protein
MAVAQGGRVWWPLAVPAEVSSSLSPADDGGCCGLTRAELAVSSLHWSELSSDGVPGPEDTMEGSLCRPLTRLLGVSGGVPAFLESASILHQSSRLMSASDQRC